MRYRVLYVAAHDLDHMSELQFNAAGDLMAMAIADPNVGGSVGSLSREAIQAWKWKWNMGLNDSPTITTRDFAYDIKFRVVPQKQEVVAMVENMETGQSLYLDRKVFRDLGLPIPKPVEPVKVPWDDNDPIWVK